ncbi:MAG: hypothetical protein ACRCYU_15580 [Nocardioides sp.]
MDRLSARSDRWPGAAASSRHPILSGLVALVAVAVVVGLFVGVAAIAVTRVLGLGGGGSGSQATAGATMFLPEPQATTAAGDGAAAPPAEEAAPSTDAAPDQESAAAKLIKLTAAPRSVATFERVNLTGTYLSGDGAILQVERRLGGRWEQFDATISVNGDRFASYVETGRQGKNEFRVRDTDNGKTSNVVVVTVN